MTSPAPDSEVSAVLVSVGGSPAPVLHVLRTCRPAHVWYFCSAGTRENAGKIQEDLDWQPQARFIEVERFEELGPCYRELRRKIPEILKETRVPASEVMVDYTGGTKTMSTALVLAAIDLFQQFSYVGGEQREKGGLGITINGKERVQYQTNPWSELAVREVERAVDLWKGFQFEEAARVLREVARRTAQPIRFETVAELADAMAARHRLDFKGAKNGLGKVGKTLPALFDGRDSAGLIDWVADSLQLCIECSGSQASPTFLRELLDNTLRTAKQGRFEDAAARLYRAMEMQGQLWLTAATNGSFQNGRCKAANRDKLPSVLTSLEICRPEEEGGDIRLSLEHLFVALAALSHEKARKIVDDIALHKKSRWRQATEKRNTSILAHGVTSIGSDGFETMASIASEFLGFDLGEETNPIVPLNPLWLA